MPPNCGVRCIAHLFVAVGLAMSPMHAAEDRPPLVPVAERLPLYRYEYDFVAMGMKYHFVVYGPDEPTVTQAIGDAEARVRQLDRVMSDYNTESEVSQLCETSSPGHPVRLSPELYDILDTPSSYRVSRTERSMSLSAQSSSCGGRLVGRRSCRHRSGWRRLASE